MLHYIECDATSVTFAHPTLLDSSLALSCWEYMEGLISAYIVIYTPLKLPKYKETQSKNW